MNQEILRGLESMRSQLADVKGLEDWSGGPRSGLVEDILEYSEHLAEEYNIALSDADQQQLIETAQQNADTSYEDSEVALRKELLNAYTDAVIEKFDLDPIGPEERQELRSSTGSRGKFDVEEITDEDDAYKLEVKTVAVYW